MYVFCRPQKQDAFPFIADYCGGFLGIVIKSFEKEGDNKFYFEGEAKERNLQIGTTPIVSTVFDSGRGLIFVSGLIDLLKGDNTNAVVTNANFLQKEEIQTLLTMLVVSGCVDKTFIDEVIDLGLNHTFTYKDAEYVSKLAHEMTHDFEKEDKFTPKDRFVAYAIDAGLFAMLLKFLSEYGNHPDNADFLLRMVLNAQAINGLTFSKHTSKAIRSCHEKVTDLLRSPNIQRLKSSRITECKIIIEMMESMFNTDITNDNLADWAFACNNCGLRLSKSDVRYCSICKSVVYCSREVRVLSSQAVLLVDSQSQTLSSARSQVGRLGINMPAN